MVGYAGYSMSNRAVQAYDGGEAPASKIHPSVPAKFVERHYAPSSWHHTSTKYNRTNFYNRSEILANLGLIEHEEYEVNPGLIEALKKYKQDLKAQKKKIPLQESNVNVTFTVWEKNKYGKKMPRAETLSNVTAVLVTDSTVRIFDANGIKICDKRKDTPNFNIGALSAGAWAYLCKMRAENSVKNLPER